MKEELNEQLAPIEVTVENTEVEATENPWFPETTEEWSTLTVPNIIRKMKEMGIADAYDPSMKKSDVIERAKSAYRKLKIKTQKDANVAEILKPKEDVEKVVFEGRLSKKEREAIEKNIVRIEKQMGTCLPTHKDILVKKLAELRFKLTSNL